MLSHLLGHLQKLKNKALEKFISTMNFIQDILYEENKMLYFNDDGKLDYLERLFMEYKNRGADDLEAAILINVKRRIKTQLELDSELLILSDQVLERAREIELRINSVCTDWRDLSFLLKKIAHKTYRMYGKQREDAAFLRAVK